MVSVMREERVPERPKVALVCLAVMRGQVARVLLEHLLVGVGGVMMMVVVRHHERTSFVRQDLTAFRLQSSQLARGLQELLLGVILVRHLGDMIVVV